MLLYAVRHAQSLANAALDPGLDSSLSELGQTQAQRLAERLKSQRIVAIYSSPFRRCLDTVQPLAKSRGLPILLRPELCEYHHVAPGSDSRRAIPPVESILQACDASIECPDHEGPLIWPMIDESLGNLIARVQSFVAFVKGRWTHPEDVVIVISHGSPVARLIEAWLTNTPGPSFRFVIDNAALTALRFHQGVSSLVCLNEVSHLRGLPSTNAANYHDDLTIKAVPPSNYW